jgi:hypothetical protein
MLLDPTGEREIVRRPLAPRLPALEGKTIALLDISKYRGDVFLDRVAQLLDERGVKVARYRKPTFTKPAPLDLRQQIRTTCDAVIEALAD